ncbi:MAG TPA: IS1595 family transposase [Pyrinomonadaceae bacterium]|nr:IS1595 family transposase [Pyrinomonadaceae bacterium]
MALTKKAPKRKAVKSEMDLIDLFDKFGNDERCRMYLEQLRWPNGVRCVRCDSDKISRIYKRNQFHCDSCQYQFSATAGTIFHDSHLSLMKWFAAIYLLSESKKGMSALQLKRTLKVAYKTAWYLCHRIREAVKDADTSLLQNIVECDEAYVGGKPANMHRNILAKHKKGFGGYDNKTMILGAVERGGQVRLEVGGKSATREVLHAFIRAKLADEAAIICTDSWAGYQGIADQDTIHATVDHKDKEWVRGIVHTNTLENVWSLFKRSIVGSYHQVSVKHLDRYLDEFEFRFNNRANPFLFRDTLLRLLASSNLEYKNLTSDNVA